jgi:ketosteroid isomerase-like protein
MKKEDISKWVGGYLKAWNSNDPEDIRSLFAQDAVYYTGPFDTPWEGRESILKNWLAKKDEPGSFTFRYEVLAVSGSLGVVRGWTTYLENDADYSNIWTIRLDADGRCEEFTEWWMRRRKKTA